MADSRLPAVVALAGLVACGLALWIALGPLGGIPHVQDEIVYAQQARLFAAGLRTGPAIELSGLIQYPFWVTEPASYGVFPPGWPAVLALGEALGVPWAVNPLLVGALPLLCWGLARELSDGTTALWAAWIAALSPGVLVLAGSQMSHTLTLVALGAGALVVLRGRDGLAAWVGAGLALGLVVLARPFDAALLGGPLLLWGLRTAPAHGARLALWLPPVAAAALIAWDNQQLTGSWSTFAVGPWFDGWVADTGRPPGCNGLGFGEDRGCHRTLESWGHTPAKAAILAGQAWQRFDRLLLGVPGGTLVALVGLWRLGARARWTVLVGVLVVLGYGLYWSPGPSYGARFYHPLYLVVPLWLAAGLRAIPRQAGALALVVPLAAAPGLLRELGDRYWCVGGELAAEGAEGLPPDAVLLVAAAGERTPSWPALGTPEFRCDPLFAFGEALLLNDPTGEGRRVRHGPAEPGRHLDQLRELWPERPLWHLEQDVASGTHRWTALP